MKLLAFHFHVKSTRLRNLHILFVGVEVVETLLCVRVENGMCEVMGLIRSSVLKAQSRSTQCSMTQKR